MALKVEDVHFALPYGLTVVALVYGLDNAENSPTTVLALNSLLERLMVAHSRVNGHVATAMLARARCRSFMSSKVQVENAATSLVRS